MGKNKIVQPTQQSLFEVDYKETTIKSVNKHHSSKKSRVHNTSVIGIGINYGDFSKYIREGRNNSIKNYNEKD